MYIKRAFKFGVSLTGDFIELIPSFFSFIKPGLLEVESLSYANNDFAPSFLMLKPHSFFGSSSLPLTVR